jgi:AcrR family transcriptional regulator
LTNSGTASSPSVRDRILIAAETLLVRHGYDGASLRDISQVAHVNLGSLVYHFGTKDGMLRALCEARLLPVIESQTKRLKACEGRLEAGEPLSLEDLFRAVFEPALRSASIEDELGGLYALMFTDPSDVVRGTAKNLFAESSNLLYRLARRLLPDMDEAEFHLRYIGIVGVVTIIQGFADRLSDVLEAPQPELPVERLIDTTIGIVIRGLADAVEQKPCSKSQARPVRQSIVRKNRNRFSA